MRARHADPARAGPDTAPDRQSPPSQEEIITMQVIRWNPTAPPMRDLLTMHQEMNRLFDGACGRPNARSTFAFVPTVEIEETPEQFVLRMDLPGVAQKDVKVHVMGDTLTIRGERRQEGSEKEGNWLRCERTYGTFERSFTLGAPVRADQVKATSKDGVLEVCVPKAEEARVREVEVKIG
jgi:HSP20 family protein